MSNQSIETSANQTVKQSGTQAVNHSFSQQRLNSLIMQAERKKRMYVITIIFPLIFAFLLYLVKRPLIELYYIRYYMVDLTIGILTMFSVFGLLMYYLQTGFKKVPNQLSFNNNINVNKHEEKLENLGLELNNLTEKVNNFEKHGFPNQAELTNEKLKELEELIKSKLINETTENLIRELEGKVEDNLNSKIFLKTIQNAFSNTLERLRREVSTLNYRSNLNLVLGIIITGVGLFLLSLFVFNGDLKHEQTLPFILQFIPKLSLVIFIEIFAFFFLSLYKTSLTEIKYYQNEMTKIENKYIALITAIELKSDDIISEVIKEISSNIGFNEQNEEMLGIGESGDTKLQQAKVNADNLVEIMGKVLDVYKKAN